MIEPRSPNPRRLRLVVQGRVQGLGFRPFVYRLAQQQALSGWIANAAHGVVIEIEGAPAQLKAFQDGLTREAPEGLVIQSIETRVIPRQGTSGFFIRSSLTPGTVYPALSPDLATCAECLRELFDPRNRRYRYPFITCAGCGPRYSIVERLPYDRCRTSMRRFPMCAECLHEYETASDRRFHTETLACPACGPHVWLIDEQGAVLAERDRAWLQACDLIRQGAIVAVKGLGGFQLWVDATNEAAVHRLRIRKHRPRKPLAVMFASLAHAARYCQVTQSEARYLYAPEAPIVLVRRREETTLASSVAPQNPEIGAMLPYTPLHHLMMQELARPVVATSGNRSDEPIVFDEGEAAHRLKGIADAFLLHNRPIVRPVDDSVVRVEQDQLRILRRARGFVPSPLWERPPAAEALTPLLAVGGHLKCTIAVTTPDHVIVSQHIGDLSTNEAYAQFVRTVDDQLALFAVRPRAIVCDLHPDYPSTAFAREYGTRNHLPVISIQHHQAHLAATMAERGLNRPALGVAWDGAGYGSDGTIWGGEFFVCESHRFTRIAHLRPFGLPGGEIAMREPRRVALALLQDALDIENVPPTLPPLASMGDNLVPIILHMLARRIHCPMTTSMGRLFDGVSALLGFCQMSTFEGEAAMALEFAAARAGESQSTKMLEAPFLLRTDGTPLNDLEALLPITGTAERPLVRHSTDPPQPWIIDWRPLIRFLLEQALSGQTANELALLFHRACAALVVRLARLVDMDHVVLGGGVFQNRVLCELLQRECQRTGITLYLPRQTPCNDGGLALGQVMLAQARLNDHPETSAISSL
ncbi:MAG: carbamoyltransferase HypF [Nitrospirae bacterium]|nr:MAG: carbamoyltransferase HypF [Nitrospirota bacterium]